MRKKVGIIEDTFCCKRLERFTAAVEPCGRVVLFGRVLPALQGRHDLSTPLSPTGTDQTCLHLSLLLNVETFAVFVTCAAYHERNRERMSTGRYIFVWYEVLCARSPS